MRNSRDRDVLYIFIFTLFLHVISPFVPNVTRYIPVYSDIFCIINTQKIFFYYDICVTSLNTGNVGCLKYEVVKAKNVDDVSSDGCQHKGFSGVYKKPQCAFSESAIHHPNLIDYESAKRCVSN